MDPEFNPKPSPRALGCVFLPFLALGMFFAVMVVREVISSAATYTWQSVPCQIVESDVRESNRLPWFAYLRYTWSGGEAVRSSRTFGTYREAVRFTRRWPAGSSATCYLDPRDSAGALLERKGAGLFMAFLLGPVRRAIQARSWRAVECKILRSEVRRNSSSKGSDTFSPEIFYSYMVDGHEHRLDTFSFFESSGSGWQSASRITGNYRPGSIVPCYVNRADPDDATLHREPSLGWLIGLLPLGVLLGGLRVWPR